MTTPQLGNTVRCAITGFTGIAIQRSEMLSGTVQLAVQPAGKEGDTTMPDAINIDVQVLDFVDAGVADRATPPDPVNLPLGLEVRDEVTGFTGITVDKVTYINGCVRYGVQGRFDTARNMFGEVVPAMFFDHKRLKPVSLKDRKAMLSGMVSAVKSGLFSPVSLPAFANPLGLTNEPEPESKPKPAKGGPNRRVASRY